MVEWKWTMLWPRKVEMSCSQQYDLVRRDEAEQKLADKDKEIERLKDELETRGRVRDLYENGPLW